MSVTETGGVLHSLTLVDEAATERLAAALAPLCRRGDCILLRGEVGAGKTTFARAFIRTLCPDAQEIVSPTFTLVQTYSCNTDAHDDGITLWHFDLYRVKYEEELMEIALDEALENGVSLIEWPDIAEGRLPDGALKLMLLAGTNAGERTLEIIADASWKERLASLKEMA